MKKPKIAITHEFLNTIGGAEQVAIKLHELFPEAPIYCLLSNQKFLQKWLPDANVISSSLNNWPQWLTNRHQIFLMQFPVVVEQFDLSEYDIVISSCNSFMKGLITKPETIHISYQHSPTRYIWDYTHQWIDDKGLGLFRPLIEWRFNALRQWDFLAADRVDVMVANSKYVADRINKYYRRSVTEVIYPPINLSQCQPSKPVKKADFFLIFGRLEPYKNIHLAIEACNELKLPLYIAGTGVAEKHLKSIAGDTVKFLGYVDDDKKVELMQTARALIFPSEEDSGIVPIEAMAAGTPIVAYRQGGLTESVIDGQTGVFFDDLSAISLQEALISFQSNQTITSAKCIDQALKFDQSVFADRIQKLVQAVYENKAKYLEQSINRAY